jgi:predicted phosphodiesterase
VKLERHVVISDMHAPFQNKDLMAKICMMIHDIRPEGFIVNGDGVDLYSLASFNADSLDLLRDLTLTKEYKLSNLMLDGLDHALPKGCTKHYLYGNHEDRYRRERERGDRGKYGDALQSPEDALRLSERGYSVGTNYKEDFVRLGDHLEVTHGIYATVHSAKKHLDEFQGSVLVGHTHRLNTFVSGKRGAWNVGFLGDLSSRGFHYISRTQRDKWTQALAVVSVSGSGDFWVEVIQVHDGRFIYAGKVY